MLRLKKCHIHRNMLRVGFSLSANLPREAEWRRDRPTPLTPFDRDAWEVYIDNLEMQEILPETEARALRGTVSKDLAKSWSSRAKRRRWVLFEVCLSSLK